LWSTGGSTQSLLLNNTNLSLGANTIWAKVTDANTCQGTDSVVITMDPCIGINKIDNQSGISIYPNPSDGKFYISLSGVEGAVELQILSLQGKILIQQQYEDVKSGDMKNIDISTFANGVYMIKLINNNSVKLERVIIQ